MLAHSNISQEILNKSKRAQELYLKGIKVEEIAKELGLSKSRILWISKKVKIEQERRSLNLIIVFIQLEEIN